MTISIPLIVSIVLIFVLTIVIIIFIAERRFARLKILIEQERTKGERQAQELGRKLFDQWAQSSVDIIRNQITDTVKRDYEVQLASWKKKEEETIRKDAIQKSINTLLGKIGEEFSPVLLSQRYGVNLKDFRHLGTPVDFIAFRGLSDESEDMEVIFLEIKSGESSGLIKRERRVRDAIAEKRVRYEVVNLNEIIGTLKDELNRSNQTSLSS
ncbi:MAG: endonuclease [Candidatus Thermoplasmatota archaeon]|nr:endonuclease [Candidatus Thermoplasmatota archaeon]